MCKHIKKVSQKWHFSTDRLIASIRQIIPAESRTVRHDKHATNLSADRQETTKAKWYIVNDQMVNDLVFDILKTNNNYKNGVKYTGTQTVCPSRA